MPLVQFGVLPAPKSPEERDDQPVVGCAAPSFAQCERFRAGLCEMYIAMRHQRPGRPAQSGSTRLSPGVTLPMQLEVHIGKLLFPKPSNNGNPRRGSATVNKSSKSSPSVNAASNGGLAEPSAFRRQARAVAADGNRAAEQFRARHDSLSRM